MKRIQTARPSAYASIDGLKMYYEVHGVGKPLILLHGRDRNVRPEPVFTLQDASGHCRRIEGPCAHGRYCSSSPFRVDMAQMNMPTGDSRYCQLSAQIEFLFIGVKFLDGIS